MLTYLNTATRCFWRDNIVNISISVIDEDTDQVQNLLFLSNNTVNEVATYKRGHGTSRSWHAK